MRPEFGQVMVMQAEGECIPNDENLAQPFRFQNPQARLDSLAIAPTLRTFTDLSIPHQHRGELVVEIRGQGSGLSICLRVVGTHSRRPSLKFWSRSQLQNHKQPIGGITDGNETIDSGIYRHDRAFRSAIPI